MRLPIAADTWRVCLGCGQEFQPKASNQRYHDNPCKQRDYVRQKQRGRLPGYRDMERPDGSCPALIDHAPLLHRTCERLESELARIPEHKREDWIQGRPLRQQPGYRNFPWLVKTLLMYKARLTRL